MSKYVTWWQYEIVGWYFKVHRGLARLHELLRLSLARPPVTVVLVVWYHRCRVLLKLYYH